VFLEQHITSNMLVNVYQSTWCNVTGDLSLQHSGCFESGQVLDVNTLRTGDADLRFYISTMQDG